ncbi:hypothetical protein [Mesorhizobium shangrilense]|uniref:Uncharacterized protein n=1 Tax=Mesorhizobium shangrilense TaxID=460060 RepID=A0ABV2DCA6_9HYPH
MAAMIISASQYPALISNMSLPETACTGCCDIFWGGPSPTDSDARTIGVEVLTGLEVKGTAARAASESSRNGYCALSWHSRI